VYIYIYIYIYSKTSHLAPSRCCGADIIHSTNIYFVVLGIKLRSSLMSASALPLSCIPASPATPKFLVSTDCASCCASRSLQTGTLSSWSRESREGEMLNRQTHREGMILSGVCSSHHAFDNVWESTTGANSRRPAREAAWLERIKRPCGNCPGGLERGRTEGQC
jgi:hypothetical protein